MLDVNHLDISIDIAKGASEIFKEKFGISYQIAAKGGYRNKVFIGTHPLASNGYLHDSNMALLKETL